MVKDADPTTYMHQHGIYLVQHFQPGDRFWIFQSIETAILSLIAIACLSFGVWWTVRRAS